ncbi:MFS transporter [Methylopila sp. M107]|uniref:MFS transporter n=1 Tax=Methylopila sp. M107 TaxID=1101190 RepID=UPI001FD892AC|nr:MFS transporter [Methylopila sp. M107]
MASRTDQSLGAPKNSPARVLFASLIGTTIEFFDFYIYATAAVLVFPKLFFPGADPATATLQSFATFAIAFFARPVGAALFGHFGDRVGRKATLVAALMTMGLSTVAIGLLPTYGPLGALGPYGDVGILAPILLCLFRIGQGLGLGGEWGGAVLLATENAPPGKEAWYGMFPQLGAPIGFLCSTGSFLLLTDLLTEEQFLNWGWRVPFVASAALVLVGLWVRLKIAETPAFQKTIEREERERVPLAAAVSGHAATLALATIAAAATFAIFYLMTVFTLSWGTSALGYTRGEFLPLQMIGVVFLGLMIPVSAKFADRFGRETTLIIASLLIVAFGFTFETLFVAGNPVSVAVFLSIGLGLMGLTYGPLGAALAELFPTAVRYTGASVAFTLAGILGASPAPYVATALGKTYGLGAVGLYLSGVAAAAAIAFWAIGRRRSFAANAAGVAA